ncbi:MAG TPA: ABC transporter permease [Thermoanaerobaculia bacterium]
MNTLFQDLRFALRMLARSPGFALVAVATLALGIGANTAIFSVVHAVLLKPLPFDRPDELVRVTADLRGQGLTDAGISPNEFFDYRNKSGAFAEISALFPINANITGMERPERAEVLLVDVDYFRMLGVKAQAGRMFEKADYKPGIAEIAVISDGWWRRHYAADPNAIGKTFRLDDDLYTIVGVAPRGFRHPGQSLQTDVEVWAPTGFAGPPYRLPIPRGAYFLRGAVARLGPGVTVAEAQRRLDALGETFRKQYPDDYREADGWSPRVIPLQQDVVGSARPALVVLLAAVGFVLLIACANVANLLLARASARRREIAVRQALGAGRLRLVRQLLTESVVLALIGGGAGLAIAVWGVDVLVRLAPANLPRATEIHVDLPVLGFTLLAALLTGLLFGLVPALQTAGRETSETLKDSARGSTGRGRRVRSVLVVAEFALALVLLTGAVLLLRTLARLHQVDPGFRPEHLVTASVWLPQPNIPETGRYFQNAPMALLYRRVLEHVRALQGVEAADGATRVPFTAFPAINSFEIEGRDPQRGGTGRAEFTSASEGYFATLGIPLKAGRAFDAHDADGAARVAVVSESLAKHYFPGESAIGHRIALPAQAGPGQGVPDGNRWMQIVGVVGDVKSLALDVEERPAVYRPLEQAPNRSLTLVVRTHLSTGALAAAIENEVRSIDSELPLYAVRTMDEAMARTLAQRRFAMRLLGLFAAAALLLSAVGISGVIAYGVSQRTQEIGIRMALGARPADVRRMLLREGAGLAGLGVALGLAGAFLLTGLMSSLLYGVGPRDPLTFLLVSGVLAAVALGATDVPARRASRVDPMKALRSD